MNLRPYQIAALNALWSYYKEHPRGVPLIVCPTGAGKSLLAASVVKKILTTKPYSVLLLSHRKEIIEQNARELQRLIPTYPIGIYSAGLGVKRIRQVTFANVQSIYKKVRELSTIHLVIIDEAHLLSNNENSMYQKAIDGLRTKNRDLKILGLTATPYRLDQGNLISDGSLFTDIAYDISLRELVEEGYLSPLTSMVKDTVDLSEVKISGYDFNQADLEEAFNKESLLDKQCHEILKLASKRKSWLIFTSGIKHAISVTDKLNSLGIRSEFVAGYMTPIERDSIIGRFVSGETQALCNCQILTTGFNYPGIDCIVLLRSTQSTALYVQCVGRGTRKFDGKTDCLVLDYGGNIERHGPIDLIQIKNKRGEKIEGDAPFKVCPKCGCAVHIKVLTCPECEYEFPVATTLEKTSSKVPILSDMEEFNVSEMDIKIHRKEGKPPSLRLEFKCGTFKTLSEFLCFEHGGYAATVAGKKWLSFGGELPIPKSAREGLERSLELKVVTKLRAIKKGKYYQILSFDFDETRAQESDRFFEEIGINI